MLRKLEQGDIELLYELEQKNFPTSYYSKTQLLEMLLEEASSIYGIEEENTLLGYAIFLNSIDCQEIIKIAVNKEHRRRGLATKLLEAEKRRPILLEVRESNLEAQEFYKRHGFEEIYVRKQYYRDNGENAIILEKK